MGSLGNSSDFSTSSLSAGTHTISLRVQDNHGGLVQCDHSQFDRDQRQWVTGDFGGRLLG